MNIPPTFDSLNLKSEFSRDQDTMEFSAQYNYPKTCSQNGRIFWKDAFKKSHDEHSIYKKSEFHVYKIVTLVLRIDFASLRKYGKILV